MAVRDIDRRVLGIHVAEEVGEVGLITCVWCRIGQTTRPPPANGRAWAVMLHQLLVQFGNVVETLGDEALGDEWSDGKRTNGMLSNDITDRMSAGQCEWRWLFTPDNSISSHFGVRSHVLTRNGVLCTLQEVCSLYICCTILLRTSWSPLSRYTSQVNCCKRWSCLIASDRTAIFYSEQPSTNTSTLCFGVFSNCACTLQSLALSRRNLYLDNDLCPLDSRP